MPRSIVVHTSAWEGWLMAQRQTNESQPCAFRTPAEDQTDAPWPCVTRGGQ